MPGLRLLALAGAAAAFDGRPAAFRRAVSLRAVDAADAPAVDAAAPADAAAAAATPFRAGFVAIVGSANVGKSTLTNALVGQELCIATRKPQTTRHRASARAPTTAKKGA
ncbi:hypothetical protein M885DRAFT_531224 [Pelagophyceae sp. CCMP2097]|nr:hypothetical protein M885DRAFT_531224 [Pelagophyceae sp. CCMP2097]